jgi:heterodisulfide reductase subunit C
MDTLRVIARRENYVSEKEIKLFFDTFLDSMKKHGRVFELGVLLKYNLRSGKLFTDADLGPKVLSRGKIHLFPTNIKGKEKVEKIFREFERKPRNEQ